jgi:hypothetical protein
MRQRARRARRVGALLGACTWLLAVPLGACSKRERDVQLQTSTSFQLLDAAKTAHELGKRDAFVAALTPLDRQLRLQSRTPVDEAKFLAFAKAQARSFKPEQSGRVVASLERLQTQLANLRLLSLLPNGVSVGLSTGNEEGAGGFDLTYTRHGVVVLNDKAVARQDLDLALAHELFHVITYKAPALRDALYRALGFQRTARLRWPDALEAERLTSPEVPVTEHVLILHSKGAAPVRLIFAWASNADYRGGGLNEYATPLWSVLDEAGVPTAFVTSDEVPGLKTALARNTIFLGGPEEILADNFAILLTSPEAAEDPAFLTTLRNVLKRHAMLVGKPNLPQER